MDPGARASSRCATRRSLHQSGRCERGLLRSGTVTSQFELPLFDSEFVPAQDKLEAVTRIAQLTGAAPERLGPGSKERKSALTGLANGLGLDVDATTTKPQLARTMTERLGGSWDHECESIGHTITLVGLNRLLEFAEAEVERRKRARPKQDDFIPARSKLEAVTRIASLTGAPEQDLGPGSKERKSALVNLAVDLTLDVHLDANKHELGRQIATALGEAWDSTCQSTGQTVTLIGLNRILRGASARRRTSRRFRSTHEEGSALARSLSVALERHLDGRTCVEEMRAAEHRQWAQDEWLGFYFEFVGLPTLLNAYSGGPVKIGNTVFDYALDAVWDLKAHALLDSRGRSSNSAPLNDASAMESCLESGRALGFLVLSGKFTYDDGEFRQWQRELRATAGKVAVPRAGAPRAKRASKPAFEAMRVDALVVPDTASLDRGLEMKVFTQMRQGRQSSGAPRPPKYSVNLPRAAEAGFVTNSYEVVH